MVTALSIDKNKFYFLESGVIREAPVGNLTTAVKLKSSGVVDFVAADGLAYEFRNNSNNIVFYVTKTATGETESSGIVVESGGKSVEFTTLYGNLRQPLPGVSQGVLSCCWCVLFDVVLHWLELTAGTEDLQVLFGTTTARVSFSAAVYENKLAGRELVVVKCTKRSGEELISCGLMDKRKFMNVGETDGLTVHGQMD